MLKLSNLHQAIGALREPAYSDVRFPIAPRHHPHADRNVHKLHSQPAERLSECASSHARHMRAVASAASARRGQLWHMRIKTDVLFGPVFEDWVKGRAAQVAEWSSQVAWLTALPFAAATLCAPSPRLQCDRASGA